MIALAIAILATSAAQVTYKLYFVRDQRWILAWTIALFCIAPAMSYVALQSLTMSTVYMATGLTYVLVVLGAWWLLDEALSRRKLLAMSLILTGAILFNL